MVEIRQRPQDSQIIKQQYNSFKQTPISKEDTLTRNVGPHKKMSIDKQLELTGEKRNMSPGHSVFLKDRDGNDINDEVLKLKQQLIRNAQD